MTHFRCFFVLVVLGFGLVSAAQAQPLEPELNYSRVRQFNIPFTIGPGKERLWQLKLWVSLDHGKTWQHAASAGPEQGKFQFIADRDGLHLFAVQTIDVDKRPFPATMEGVTPHRRVIVDTIPPVVTLKQIPAEHGLVGVTWTIQDANYTLSAQDAFRLEYRAIGGLGWFPLVPRAADKVFWNPETNAPLEVRLRVKDRAGNANEATIKLAPGENLGAFPKNPPQKDPEPVGTEPVAAERKFINSTHISLNFEIKDKGPSGIAALELWFTQDGRSWNKHPLPKTADGLEIQSPLRFQVGGEGVYGFTLLARSGVGLGERSPQVGDQPQVWVEVDLTKPVVQLQNITVGQGPDKGKLFISWKASDKNLGSTPISLAYAEKQEGPWLPIADKKLPNHGKYVWLMPQGDPPQGVPYQFHVRVEAVDLAGNVGAAVTQELVRVDLLLPKVKILTVEPAGK